VTQNYRMTDIVANYWSPIYEGKTINDYVQRKSTVTVDFFISLMTKSQDALACCLLPRHQSSVNVSFAEET